MDSLKSLDELNKPGPSILKNPGTPMGSPKLNRNKPEFASAEKMAKTLLASAKLPPNRTAPRPSPKPTSSEPKADKRMEKIYKINRYLETFERVRESVQVPMNLANLSEAELDQILFSIQRVLNSSSPETMIPVGITALFTQIENVTMYHQFNPLNLDLTGLSRVTSEPKNVAKLTDIAKELYIKYEHLFSMGPESRFMIEIVSFLIIVDRFNKAKATPVTQDQIDKVEQELNDQKGKEPME